MPVPDEYSIDSNGSEFYSKENGVEVVVQNRYALDSDKIPFYPRDAHQNEFMDPDLGLIERNGKYEYPRLADGKPHYRVDPTDQGPIKKQLYEKINDKYIMGTDLLGNMVYAIDSKGDEYYPEDNTPAKKVNGAIFYARAANKIDVIFPINADGDEFYLTFIDPSEAGTNPGKYACKSNGDEVYPQRLVRGGLMSDYIINNTYAKRSGVKYYPKDGYNNEFYVVPAPNTGTNPPTDLLLDSYAATNDGKIILPGIGDDHYIDPNVQPAVTEADIIGRLVREENEVSSDYLTKIEVPVDPKVSPREYKYFDFKTNIFKSVRPPGVAAAPTRQVIVIPFFKTWYFCLLLVFSIVILKSFLVWWFFFRSNQVNLKNRDFFGPQTVE